MSEYSRLSQLSEGHRKYRFSIPYIHMPCRTGEKRNQMNRVLSHLCAHIGQTGPGETPKDGERNEMTLSTTTVLKHFEDAV